MRVASLRHETKGWIITLHREIKYAFIEFTNWKFLSCYLRPAVDEPSMWKQTLDLTGSAVGLVLVSPLLLLIAALIKLSDGGPVFFRQQRVGQHGRVFRIWKFRTMVPDAEQKGRSLTVGRDSRITTVGHWLRKWKLDEFPQLLNVFCGEMSLIGPRPEVPKYVALYSPAQRKVLKLKPGITDPASIRYRNESDLLARSADPDRVYIRTIMPHKIQMNLAYAQSATLWSDLRVLLQTLLPLTSDAPTDAERPTP